VFEPDITYKPSPSTRYIFASLEIAIKEAFAGTVMLGDKGYVPDALEIPAVNDTEEPSVLALATIRLLILTTVLLAAELVTILAEVVDTLATAVAAVTVAMFKRFGAVMLSSSE